NKGVGLERLEQGTKTSDVAVTVDTNDLAAEIGSFRELAQCRRRNRKEIAKHEIVGGGEIDEFGSSRCEPGVESRWCAAILVVFDEANDRMLALQALNDLDA